MTALLAFWVAFVFRLSSLYPSVSPSDSSRVADILTWRWSQFPWHDPSILVTKLFTMFIPFGNAVFRINLLSPVLAGTAATLLVRIFLLFFPTPTSRQTFVQMEDTRWRKACAWIAGIALILFPPITNLFRVPNRDALSMIVLLVALMLALRLSKSPSAYRTDQSALFPFVLGLGFGTAYYFICLVPGVLDIHLSSRTNLPVPPKKRRSIKSIAYVSIAFLAGFLLTRPDAIESLFQPASYGQLFLNTLTSLSDGLISLGQLIVQSMHSMAHNFTLFGLFLCLWGVYRLQKDNEVFARAIGISILGAAIALPWATPAFTALPIGVLAAYGLHDLGVRFFKKRSLGIAILGLSVCLGLSGWDRRNLQARDLSTNVFQSLPMGSIFLPRTEALRDMMSYAQNASGLRRDVEIRDGSAPPEPQFQAALNAVYSVDPERPLFFEPSDAVPESDLLPYGVAFRYFPSRDHKLLNPASQVSLLRFSFWWYRRTSPWNPALYSQDAATRSIVQRYTDAHLALAAKSREFGLNDFYHLENLAAFSLSPRNDKALTNLGEEALEKKNYMQAVQFFHDAATTNPFDAALNFHLGQALQGAGHPIEALQAFKNAVALAPNFQDAHRRLAESQDASKRYEDALPQWKWLMDQNPQDKDTVWRLIQDYQFTGRSDKAKELLQEYFLMSLTPDEKSRAEVFYDVVMGRIKP